MSADEQNCSCSETDSDQDSDVGVGGGGNNSDPGLDSTNQVSRRCVTGRSRSGSGNSTSWARKERLKIEEDKRKRIEFVERSKRETRMVDLARLSAIERLWVGEKEINLVRREKREVEGRLRLEVGQGVEELRRDREERRDRVGDLDGVGEAVREEVDELRGELEGRRERLEKRKDRLRMVREMDERDRGALKELSEELDEKEYVVRCSQFLFSLLSVGISRTVEPSLHYNPQVSLDVPTSLHSYPTSSRSSPSFLLPQTHLHLPYFSRSILSPSPTRPTLRHTLTISSRPPLGMQHT